MSLLTKRTIGASSTCRVDLVVELVLPAGDFEGLEIDVRVIRERRHLVVDLLDRLVERFLELVVLDNDRFDGKTGLEFDLIDGMEVRRVGHGQKQPLATTEQRQHAMLGQSLSLTRRTVSRSRFIASRSNNGTPNSFEAATAMSRALAAPLVTSWVTTLVLRSRAALTASSIATSSTTPSCTRRWQAAEAAAAGALS